MRVFHLPLTLKGSLKRKPGAFLFMFTNEYEKRIKMLEENLAWTQRDLVNLINIYENMHPEIHYHFYYDMRACKGNDQSQSNDINDFI